MPINKQSPLLQAPFLLLMAFRVGITLSYQVFNVAVAWHAYQITQDVMSLGWVGLAELVPYFATALFAGYWVDTYSRRKLTLFAALLHVGLAAAVAATTKETYPWTVAYLYAAVGVGGLARAFVRPLYQALMASVLPREAYSKGAAVSSTVFQACLVLGPAMAGFVISQQGVTAAYILAGGLAALGLLGGLLLRPVYELTQAAPAPVFQSIREGFQFVFGQQLILAALTLDMFAVLFGGAVSILPAFIDQVLNSDPSVLGLLRAAPAMGSTLVGVLLARFTLDRYAGAILLGCVAAFGLCIVGFGLSTSVGMAFAFLLLSGVFDGVSVVIRSTLLQLLTPDDMRGRVSAINGIFIGSSNELGAFESGLTASALGLVPSIVVGGCVTLGVVWLTDRKAPSLRHLHMNTLT